MTKLETIKQNLRLDHWVQGKITLFCMTMFYLILKHSLYSMYTISQFVNFLIFIVLVSIYGYLINDFFDLEIDRKQGKQNAIDKIGKARGGLIISLIFFVSLLLALNFVVKDYFLYLLVVIYFLATFYSAPPIRFKEKGITGLFIAFLTQYPIPVMMIFSVFDSFGGLDMWGFVIFTTVSGATIEIGHQLSDLKRDITTETKTFAVKHGYNKMDRLYQTFLLLNLVSMFGILIIMYFELRLIDIYGQINVMLPPLLTYIILSLIVIRKFMQDKEQLVDPYHIKGGKDIFNITYTLFPNCLLPFYLSCITFMNYYLFVILMVTFLVITFMSVSIKNISWPIRVIQSEFLRLIGREQS